MPYLTSTFAGSILDALEDGVYLINRHYEIEYMNKSMKEIYGDIIGSKCYNAFTGKQTICPWCRAEEVFSGEDPVKWNHHNYKTGRTYRMIELPVKFEDGRTFKMTICREVAENTATVGRKTAGKNYKRLFESVGCGVYLSSKEGKFLDANPALLDMLKYDNKEEFLSVDLSREVYVKPENRKKFQQLIEKNGHVIDYEVDFKCRDGEVKPVLITGHVLSDDTGKIVGYEGIIADQSQRKKMEQELNEAHHFLNMIVQNSPNAIMAARPDGTLIIWNRAAEKVLGFSAGEMIENKTLTDVFSEEVAERIMRRLRSPDHGGPGVLTSCSMVYKRPDQGIVEGNLSAAVLHDQAGEEIASVLIFVDLNKRLQIEKSLRDTQEQLFQSEKLAAMGKLTSQIAHELNNPLYGIMNTLELLKTEISPESKRRKILEMALSETIRLTEMLKKMLSFSKPDEEEKTLTDVGRVVDEILMLHEKQLWEHSIKVIARFQEPLPPVVASKNQLRQVFLNILSNARGAMPDGGRLTVTTLSENDQVLVSFQDTGIGIREEHKKKIFESFFTTKGKVQGVGLGLAVCYGLVKEHGGDIQVESTPGEGSTFTVYLPVAQTP